MNTFDRQTHWENVHKTKQLHEVSWFEPTPTTSLEFIKQFNVPITAKIIDVGGGDSLLVDHLLDLGYQNITVLDISKTAINKAMARLGERAEKVNWIVADASKFTPTGVFDFWHDRAAFHFLTLDSEIENYISTIQRYVKPDGILVIGTFSVQGPKKCSGIGIKQYSEMSMTDRLKKFFKKIKCITIDHKTPFNTIQNFIFCSFRRKMKSVA